MVDLAGVKRQAEQDRDPNPPIRPLPHILDYVTERGLVRNAWNWNPFASDPRQPSNPTPPGSPNSDLVPVVPQLPLPPRTHLLQRAIPGHVPSGGDDDPRRPSEPEVTFRCCGGLEEQIDYVRRNFIWILNNQVEFNKWGVEPIKGMIFYGPPGSGKTLLAKAIVNEVRTSDGRRFSFYMKKGPEMFGMYVGQTEGAIRKLFRDASATAPSIIFLDELDGLCTSREDASPNSKFHNGVVTQLLGCMDEVVRGEVLVIGATNRLESIDPAFRRPGRFDKCVSFHLPNAGARTTILRIHTRRWMNKPSSVDYEAVGQATVGYTGADLEQLCQKTFVIALQRQFPNFGPTASLNLTRLQILAADWKKAMMDTIRTNTNVFGVAYYGGELANPAIRLLTSGIESELSAKLLPWLRRLRQSEETKVHSCLVWSENRRTVETANNFIIPSWVSSLDTSEILAFKMDVGDIINCRTISVFMGKVMESRKPRVLFIPFIDDLMDFAIQANSWLALTSELGRVRGTNLIILATACKDNHDLQEDMASLLATAESFRIL